MYKIPLSLSSMSRLSYCPPLVGNNSQLNQGEPSDSFGGNSNPFGLPLSNFSGGIGNNINQGLNPNLNANLNPCLNNNVPSNICPSIVPSLAPNLALNMSSSQGQGSNGSNGSLKTQNSATSGNSPTLSPNTSGSRGSYVPSQKDTTFTKIFVGGLPYHTSGVIFRLSAKYL